MIIKKRAVFDLMFFFYNFLLLNIVQIVWGHLFLINLFANECYDVSCTIAAGMNEDGSFIGQYGRKRRPPTSSQPDSASQAFATLV